MNDLINIDAINTLDLSSIKDASLVKESESLAALQAKIKSGAAKLAGTVDAVQREQAIILHRIQFTKLYEKDGFKSLREYAETIGLGKSAAHALANAGKVYSDKEAPDNLKNMSAYNLAAINSAINSNKEQVYKDAASGALDGMSQDQLKSYAAATKTTKAKVVKTYTMTSYDKDSTASNALFPDGRRDGTVDEWKSLFSEYEVISVAADKDGNKRLLVVYPNKNSELFTLTEYKPNSNGKTKTTTGKAEFLARAVDEGMSDEQIRQVCRVMGW